MLQHIARTPEKTENRTSGIQPSIRIDKLQVFLKYTGINAYAVTLMLCEQHELAKSPGRMLVSAPLCQGKGRQISISLQQQRQSTD
uniref:GBF1 n=1 Tax=Arundo donax TaxID=35708 RepID=A0A0A8XQF3_ARUDO